MFEGFAYIMVALVGGYGALTGYLPAMLIALFGDSSVLTPVGDTSGFNWASILLGNAITQTAPISDVTSGQPGGSQSGITNLPTYRGAPFGPGGPVISGVPSAPQEPPGQVTSA